MAEYVIGSPNGRRRIGILPSAFNPPTIAHLALASAAEQQAQLDQVVFALPRTLPHKSFVGASLEQRTQMLQAVVDGDNSRAVAVTRGGLFIEIAREFKEAAENDAEVFLICGRDAAERIVNWDYGSGPSFEQQLEEFALIVGNRAGSFAAQAHHSTRTIPVALPLEMDHVSSETLRARRQDNEDWQHLTDPGVARLIEAWSLYR